MDCYIRIVFAILLLANLSYISCDCNTVFPGLTTFQNCQYRCHCKEDRQCNTTTGECENGCDFGWMGPGCQYRNVAKFNAGVYNMGPTTIPSDYSVLAVDGNVTTCSRSNGTAPNGHHYWRIQWDKEYRIVGLVLKIQPNDTDEFNSFRVETGYGPDGSNFNSICYQHGDSPGRPVMEIMCHEKVWTKNLRIILNETNTRIRLCEVEIYGGRVVTFNKPTNQSSTYQNSTSSLAVDGQPQVSGQIAETTCSTTAGFENNPHWLVNFQAEYNVQSVYFYGRLDLYPSQYSGFQIYLIDGGSLGTNIYDDSGSGTVDQYQPKRVDLTSPIIARFVKINRPVDNALLTICEVEAYADCPPHKCGSDCLSDCYCTTDITGGFQENGTCPYGCYGRWTGLDNKCDTECNDTSWGNQCQYACGHCLNTSCDIHTGYCENGCSGNFEPPQCVKGCLNGTYGLDCTGICGNCSGGWLSCDQTTGACIHGCTAGYKGDQCKQTCEPGEYGQNCNETCGTCRDIHDCDIITGNCTTGCREDWKGPHCRTGNLTTTMSSVDHGWNPENAISSFNGTRDPYTCGCCSGTQNATLSWWKLDLGNPYPLKEMRIYKAYNEQVFNDLNGFSVYLGNDTTIEPTLIYTDNSTVHGDGRFEFSLSNTSARYVTIKRAGVLTLCNVSLIEAGCPIGYFSFDCMEGCHCADNKPCNKTTGVCQSSGCKLGWNGTSCNNECPFQTFGEDCKFSCYCKNGTCTKDYGNCTTGCEAGYKGDHCNEDCPIGYFSFDCMEGCHCADNKPCDKTTGVCQSSGCKLGWNGTSCNNECPFQTFGEDCKFSCYCKNGTCTKDYGNCTTGCEAGYKGNHCNEDCPIGYFSFDCMEGCHCADNKPCDKTTGVCQSSGCKLGWNGTSCNNECPFQTFGEDCKFSCYCKNGTCSKDYGTCTTGCQAGYKGNHCNEECSDGTFGDGCSQLCYCNGRTCTKNNGTCPDGCMKGYKGLHCNEHSDNGDGKHSSLNIYMIIGISLGGVVLIVANILLYIFRGNLKSWCTKRSFQRLNP